jgi:hypothetical protein
MVPKINFVYSWIYDLHWKEQFKKNPPKFALKNYPSPKRIRSYLDEIKPLWKKSERKILTELSKVSGLKWKEKEIKAYIVGTSYPFSDPLTMPIYNKREWFIDVLTHELIHQLFTQEGNFEKSNNSWKYIDKKWKNESHSTRIHIPLHAIHKHLYLKFFGKGRLKREQKIMGKHKTYSNSWKIVEREGHEKIVKEFKKRLKG